MLVFAVVAGVVSALMGVPGPAASDAPPTGAMIIDAVTVAGNGCRIGSVIPNIAPDNSAIRIDWTGMPDLVTSQPAGVRLNCQTALHVFAPPGYSFGVASASHLWQVELDDQESLTLRTQQYFSGGGLAEPIVHNLVGPHYDVWEPGASYDPPAMSPCGLPVTLNLNSTTLAAGGTIELFRISDTFRLVWTTC